MKVTYRIPTEMYAYVELEAEILDDAMSAEQMAANYQYYVDAFKVRPVNLLPDKDYNQFIDNLLLGKDNHIETWEKLSPAQKESAQVIKRALKRIEYKNRV